MKREEAALGGIRGYFGSVSEKKPQTVEERLAELTERVNDLTRAFNATHSGSLQRKRSAIPYGTPLYGSCQNGNFVCTVLEDGFYVGNMKYPSLSAAAEAVSGVRRSGWTFWKTAEGVSAKDAFAK